MRKAEDFVGTYAVGSAADQRRLHAELSQKVAQIRTKLNFITKHILVNGAKQVNAVGSQGKVPTHDDYEYNEDANYVNDQEAGFRTNAKGLIETLCAKVKGIKVGTLTEITTSIGMGTPVRTRA